MCGKRVIEDIVTPGEWRDNQRGIPRDIRDAAIQGPVTSKLERQERSHRYVSETFERLEATRGDRLRRALDPLHCGPAWIQARDVRRQNTRAHRGRLWPAQRTNGGEEQGDGGMGGESG